MAAFDGLKARLERLFAESAGDPAAGLREALVEMRVGLGVMRDALHRTEQELAAERRQLGDAERRQSLAADINDAETVRVAERFVIRHRERSAVLERKLSVQRDELALAEREVEELTAQYRSSSLGAGEAAASIKRAWRDLAAAGGTRPEMDLDAELEKAEADRKLHEAAVEAQLAQLKRKLGRQP